MLTADRERVAETRVRIAEVRGKIGDFWWDHKAYPHQIPPEGDWFFWLLEEGRGAGKSAGGAQYVARHMNSPPCFSPEVPHRVALIAPTLGDAIESAVTDDDALVRLHKDAKFTMSVGGSTVLWPNGSQVRLFGTLNRQDVERLRAGGNRCLVWAEELATWRQLDEAWKHMMLGLRIGPNPRVIATTTPKPRPEYVKVRLQADHITHATTDDNPNLNPEHRKRLHDLYDGTSIGEQELKGKLIEEADGAIWTMTLVTAAQKWELLKPEDGDATVVDGHDIGHLSRIVVAIDPPGGATEAGIIVAGILRDCPCKGPQLPHFAVLEDVSGKLSPVQWGGRAVDAHRKWSGDRILAESNFGGDMVEATIRNIDKTVPYKYVRATRGKQIRAEPIKALYEQCVAEGSMIATAHGEIPIEQIQAGDQVWTRKGLRRVIWSGQTGTKPTVDIHADGRRLRCTGDHPVFISGRGFVDAATLVPITDKVVIWDNSNAETVEHESPNQGDDASHVPPQFDGRHAARSASSCSTKGFGTTSRLMVTGVHPDTEETNFSTELFIGRRSDRYLKAHTSTMLTTIRRTTPRRILWSWNQEPIQATIGHRWLTRFANEWVKRNGNGGRTGNPLSMSVRNVASPISLPRSDVSGSAHQPATRATGIVKVQPGPVVAVYNLTVDGEPEFFADGILVHNCRVHHVREFQALEGEMVQWVPGESEWSPNRLDALVWAITELSTRPEWTVG